VPEEQLFRLRPVDLIRPKGPISHGDFWRAVRRGDIELEHAGRKSFTRFRTVVELQNHLIAKHRAREDAAK
jgi:hypothetical protein